MPSGRGARIGPYLGHGHLGGEDRRGDRRQGHREDLGAEEAHVPREQRGDEQDPRHDRCEEVHDVPHGYEAAGKAREELDDGRLDRADVGGSRGCDGDDQDGDDDASDVARAASEPSVGDDAEHRCLPASTHVRHRDRLDGRRIGGWTVGVVKLGGQRSLPSLQVLRSARCTNPLSCDDVAPSVDGEGHGCTRRACCRHLFRVIRAPSHGLNPPDSAAPLPVTGTPPLRCRAFARRFPVRRRCSHPRAQSPSTNHTEQVMRPADDGCWLS